MNSNNIDKLARQLQQSWCKNPSWQSLAREVLHGTCGEREPSLQDALEVIFANSGFSINGDFAGKGVQRVFLHALTRHEGDDFIRELTHCLTPKTALVTDDHQQHMEAFIAEHRASFDTGCDCVSRGSDTYAECCGAKSDGTERINNAMVETANELFPNRADNHGANFPQALEWLKAGRRVRQQGWTDGGWIELRGDMFWCEQGVVMLSGASALATDWEVVA